MNYDLERTEPPSALRRRRNRVLVFLGVFVAVAAAGLYYTYSRPAEYRAGARVELIIPPQVEVGGGANDQILGFLGEVQRLTSRPVLERMLAQAGGAAAFGAAGDPEALEAMQQMVVVAPVEGSRVVQLWANGPDPRILPLALNTLLDVYRQDLAARTRTDSGEATALAQDEAKRLEDSVAAKRREVEAFRDRHQIVSLEREENQVLSRLRGQTNALNNAEEKLAAAEGKARSIREAVAAGAAPVRARDNPTLANLEQRASALREEFRDLERVYKPDYLALDPGVAAKRARLAELEAQIERERKASQRHAVEEAEQELVGARMVVERLREQLAGDRGKVQAFAARIAEYKTMTEQLAGLEMLRRTAAERAVKLRTSERVRAPSVKLLEAAVQPQEPWWPNYQRDAGISLAAALAAAVIALLVYDFVTRREDTGTTVVVSATPVPVPMPGLSYQAPTALGVAESAGALAAPVRTLPGAPPQLTAAPLLPRELSDSEVAVLLASADPDAQIALALLLSGLDGEEVLALRWADVDLHERALNVAGHNARKLAVDEPLHRLLAAARGRAEGTPEAPVVALEAGHGRDLAELDSVVACAAHDASVEDASSVSAASVRHTYLAFLVRQGIRFSALTRLAGGLSPAQLTAYMGLSPEGARLPLERISRTMPALLAAADTVDSGEARTARGQAT